MTDIQKIIFNFAYGAGLGDATRQKAYKGKESELRKNEKAREIVRVYIEDVISGNHPDFYATAKKVKDSFNTFENDNNLPVIFSFGNSQKLINITVKFMYILAYNDHMNMKKCFEQCHCPLDRRMGKYVKDQIKKDKNQFPPEIQKIVNSNTWKKFDGTWSKITVDEYKDYQSIVKYFAGKDGLIPVEFDYKHFQ